MRYYFLIMIRLLSLAGCASSARKNPNSPIASPTDVNSSDDADFNEFEPELAENQVAIPDPIESWNRAMFGLMTDFISGSQSQLCRLMKK